MQKTVYHRSFIREMNEGEIKVRGEREEEISGGWLSLLLRDDERSGADGAERRSGGGGAERQDCAGGWRVKGTIAMVIVRVCLFLLLSSVSSVVLVISWT